MHRWGLTPDKEALSSELRDIGPGSSSKSRAVLDWLEARQSGRAPPEVARTQELFCAG